MNIIFCTDNTYNESLKYNDAFLDEKRKIGDPLSDKVINELVNTKVPFANSIAYIKENRNLTVFKNLIDHCWSTPSWYDYRQVKMSQNFAQRNFIFGGIILGMASLMESYASNEASKILYSTGMLKERSYQRVFETANFVSDMFHYDDISKDDKARDTILKVRLMHSMVRYGVLKSNRLDIKGHPVNQEDMASTLLMFSYVFCRGYAQLGIAPTIEERESIHHTWRFIGYLMGVDQDLLTQNINQEEELYRAITARQFKVSTEGRELAHALICSLDSNYPFYLPADFYYSLSRNLIGDQLADIYGFQKSLPFSVLNNILTSGANIWRVLQYLQPLKVLSEKSGKVASRSLVHWALKQKPSYLAATN